MAWEWLDEALHIHWFLTTEEQELLSNKTPHGRLGFAVLLKNFQNEGRFPEHFKDVPHVVLMYLANQIDVPRSSLEDYALDGRTAKRDRKEILTILGIHRSTKRDRQALSATLKTDLLPNNPSFAVLQEFALAWFKTRLIEPPASEQLERFIRTTSRDFESHLLHQITAGMTVETKASIDRLLNIPDDNNDTEVSDDTDEASQSLTWLKGQSGNVSLKNILQAIKRVGCLKQMAIPSSFMVKLPLKWLQKYHRRAMTESSWELRRHPEHIRYALVAAFCWQRQRDITDDLIDLLIQITHNIGKRAENKIDKQLLEHFKHVRGKNTLLFKLAEAAIEQPEGVIKDVLYPTVSLETLKNVVVEFKSKGKPYQEEVHHIVRRSYSHHYL